MDIKHTPDLLHLRKHDPLQSDLQHNRIFASMAEHLTESLQYEVVLNILEVS